MISYNISDSRCENGNSLYYHYICIYRIHYTKSAILTNINNVQINSTQ